MAKKKRKINVRRIAGRARAKAGKLEPMKIVAATGGGFLAALAIDKIDDIKTTKDGVETLMFADKPFAAPLIVEAAAIAGTMFLKDETAKVACYGAMGGAGAQLYAPVMDMMDKDKPANGTSTINGPQGFKNFVNRVSKRLDMHKKGNVPGGGFLNKTGASSLPQFRPNTKQGGQSARKVVRHDSIPGGMSRTSSGGTSRVGGGRGSATNWRQFSGNGSEC